VFPDLEQGSKLAWVERRWVCSFQDMEAMVGTWEVVMEVQRVVMASKRAGTEESVEADMMAAKKAVVRKEVVMEGVEGKGNTPNVWKQHYFREKDDAMFVINLEQKPMTTTTHYSLERILSTNKYHR
jgi:hypothetical protein